MISDLLSQALDDMKPYMKEMTSKSGVWTAAEIAMIASLHGQMRSVLAYLDNWPIKSDHQR